MTSLTDLLSNSIEGIPGFKSVSSALGYAEGTPIMTQCWQQLQTHPITAATGAIVSGWIGYSTFGIVGGLAAFVTPNLVTSPKVMNAAYGVLHYGTSLYSSQYIQDMGPALNSLAKDFVWSVPSNQEIVVGRLNTLLATMDYPTKTAFLEYLYQLTADKKEDAHTLLSALVVLNVPPSEHIAFCRILEKVPSSERDLFVLAAIYLGIPASQRLACYEILSEIPANERAIFVQQANSLLDDSMPEQAQKEVVRILSLVPAADRDAYIGALNTISHKTDVARVQIMQALEAITVDRAVVATNYNLIIKKLSLTQKEKSDLTSNDKLSILKAAGNLTGKQMIDTLWEKADKYLSIENQTPFNKIVLFQNLSRIPEVIRVDVIKIVADKWNIEDRNKVFRNMAKLNNDDAQLLHDHNIVELFADLKPEDQDLFLQAMNKHKAHPVKLGELLEILRNKDFITSLKSSMPRFGLRSSPNSSRQSSFAKKLVAFEQSIPVPSSQIPQQGAILPSNSNSSSSVSPKNPFDELLNSSTSVSTKNPFDELLKHSSSSSSSWNWDPIPLASASSESSSDSDSISDSSSESSSDSDSMSDSASERDPSLKLDEEESRLVHSHVPTTMEKSGIPRKTFADSYDAESSPRSFSRFFSFFKKKEGKK